MVPCGFESEVYEREVDFTPGSRCSILSILRVSCRVVSGLVATITLFKPIISGP